MSIQKDRAFLANVSPKIQELVEYWDALRGTREMPTRAEFDPLDIPRHLPGVLFIDVEGVDDQGVGIYRYRVVGTDEVENRGHNPTGKLVDEGFFYESLEGAKAQYESVRLGKACSYVISDFMTDDFRSVNEAMILVPFGNENGTVTHILVYSERVEKLLR